MDITLNEVQKDTFTLSRVISYWTPIINNKRNKRWVTYKVRDGTILRTPLELCDYLQHSDAYNDYIAVKYKAYLQAVYKNNTKKYIYENEIDRYINPHECNWCTKRFRTQCTLNRHRCRTRPDNLVSVSAHWSDPIDGKLRKGLMESHGHESMDWKKKLTNLYVVKSHLHLLNKAMTGAIVAYWILDDENKISEDDERYIIYKRNLHNERGYNYACHKLSPYSYLNNVCTKKLRWNYNDEYVSCCPLIHEEQYNKDRRIYSLSDNEKYILNQANLI